MTAEAPIILRYSDFDPIHEMINDTSLEHVDDDVTLATWLQDIYNYDPAHPEGSIRPIYTARNLAALRAIADWLEANGKLVDALEA